MSSKDAGTAGVAAKASRQDAGEFVSACDTVEEDILVKVDRKSRCLKEGVIRVRSRPFASARK